MDDGAAPPAPSWLSIGAAAFLGAGSVAITALWMHRRVLERLLEQRLRKITRGREWIVENGGKRSKVKMRRGHSVPPHKDVRHASPVEMWWSENGEGRKQEGGGSALKSSVSGVERQENGAAPVEDPAAIDQNEKVVETGITPSGSCKSRSKSPSLSSDRDQDDDKLASVAKARTRLEGSGQAFAHSASNRRTAHLRPSTPLSASKSGLFDMDGSDEDVNVEVDVDLEGIVKEEPVAVDDIANEEAMPGDSLEESLSRMEEEARTFGLSHSPSLECLVASLEQQNEKSESHSTRHCLVDELLGAPDPVAADILRKEPQQETFVRMKVTPYDPPTAEEEEVCIMLQQCLALREKYLFVEKDPPWRKGMSFASEVSPDPFHYEPEPRSQHVYKEIDGVIHVYANSEAKEEMFPVPDATTFFTDMHRILRITGLGNVRSFCYHRLHLLEQKFSLHLMLNADREFLAQKSAPHRDFYNVRKVDTHVHHSSCMNQKHLLRFIKSKLRNEPGEVVIFRDGQYLTLKEVFESLDLTGYDLNVDLLDVHADKNTFHRFDKFNLKYNPCGQSRLREIFLKQDNLIQGRFLAELTQEVFRDLAVSKYQMAEYRISVYGRKQSEWDQLASWIVNNELYSENVVWLIQVPRLYILYKTMGIVTSFQTILENLFLPLFEVTVDPASHPQLHIFLKQVVGFDMVDDESKPERRPNKHMQTPAQWDIKFNPAYSYWAYYIYANMYTLNKLRESKGLCTIKFRPHSGEAGDLDHLASTFLLAHNIAHGNNLRKSPVLQYLYYLAQIGLAMSPLSNNSLFLDYHRNPFPMFFSRGLNVSLSTDDPLQIHLTKEPLVEEYSIAAQVWKLSSCDLCEIARNSVYQSGFPHHLKLHWIGHKYFKRGAAGNNIHKTNVPHMRVEFRYETWQEELQYICLGGARIPEEIDS